MDNKLNDILAGLNDEQGKAVRATSGPTLIVAGAGSGKTRVLTSRIAYLLVEGVPADKILALTFTRKAAAEMKERITSMVGRASSRHLVMGTFHSVFIRFLREYSESVGYPQNFTIYDTSDQISAVKTCIRELGLDDKIYVPRKVLARISSSKNNLITYRAYAASEEIRKQDLNYKRPRMPELYALYQEKLKMAGAMDYDDILLNMNVLLRDSQEALEEISSRFSHILVDEYQDTNYAQYKIVLKLAGSHRNVCVVGDDSQSIYAFRGAMVQNILNFKRDFPESRIFRLELNYRSTPTIVGAANSVIAHNSQRIPKDCRAASPDKGERIKVIRAYDEKDEASRVVNEILTRLRSDGAKYEDFAILYRTNSQSRILEEHLRRRNIPYMIYSGNSFFERAEVKDLMAYFKLAVNPLDDESFKRIVNRPARGIGDTTLAALATAAQVQKTTLFKAVFLDNLESFGVKPAAIAKLKAFCNMMDTFHARVSDTDAFDLARRIADDSGLYAFFKSDNSIEGQSRTSNVEELVNSVLSFVEEQKEQADEDADTEHMLITLDYFLENAALLSNADTSDGDDVSNKVALMTVHSSKGLEFPYVMICGLEENLFPSGSNSVNMTPSDLEEERRLFYVALTRAEKAVTLLFADERMRNGKKDCNKPSRFIQEIDDQYLEGYDRSSVEHGLSYGRSGPVIEFRRPAARTSVPSKSVSAKSFSTNASPDRPAAAQRPAIIDSDFVPVPMTELYAGERIEHNRFGAGRIIEITGTVPELKARVNFDQYGEKLLMLKYAKLRPERK